VTNRRGARQSRISCLRSDSSNVPRRHDIPLAPERKHRLLYGRSSDASEVGDPLRAFFIHLESRRVDIGGITTALPDTILGRYQRLVARKFDGSRRRRTRYDKALECRERLGGVLRDYHRDAA
jgi:hypothetical protein